MGDFLSVMYGLEKEYGSIDNIPEDEPRLVEAREVERKHNRAQAKAMATPLKHFTKSEESKVVELYNDNKTADEIADHLGVDKLDSERAIQNLRKKGSVSVNNAREVKKQALKDKIKPHYAKGLNYSQIAKEVGVSQPTASRYVKEMIKDGEIEENKSVNHGGRNSYSKADDEKIMSLREQGKTFKEIGQAVKRTKQSISARYNILKDRYDLEDLGHVEILKRKIIPLYEKGLSYSDIAVEIDRSKGTVQNRVSELIEEGRLERRFSVGVGGTYYPTTTVKKIKKGVPTVVEINGNDYVLRHKDQYKG